MVTIPKREIIPNEKTEKCDVIAQVIQEFSTNTLKVSSVKQIKIENNSNHQVMSNLLHSVDNFMSLSFSNNYFPTRLYYCVLF